jgi:hypothetical protein
MLSCRRVLPIHTSAPITFASPRIIKTSPSANCGRWSERGWARRPVARAHKRKLREDSDHPRKEEPGAAHLQPAYSPVTRRDVPVPQPQSFGRGETTRPALEHESLFTGFSISDRISHASSVASRWPVFDPISRGCRPGAARKIAWQGPLFRSPLIPATCMRFAMTVRFFGSSTMRGSPWHLFPKATSVAVPSRSPRLILSKDEQPGG